MSDINHYRTLLYLLFTATGPCTGPMLAQATDVSLKTLRKNIHEANGFLTSWEMKIESRTGVGYWITYQDKVNYDVLRASVVDQYQEQQFYHTSRRNRAHYIIRRLLCSSFVTVDDLADKMYYSSSVITRDIRLAREILKQYNLSFYQRADSGLRLKGSEWDIRMALIGELRIYLGNSLMLEETDPEFEMMFYYDDSLSIPRLSGTLMQALRKDYNLSVEDVENLAVRLLLSLLRREHTAEIVIPQQEITDLRESGMLARCEEICGEVQGLMGIRLQPQDIEGFAVLLQICHEPPLHLEEPLKLFHAAEMVKHLQKYYSADYADETVPSMNEFLHLLDQEISRMIRQRTCHYYPDLDDTSFIRRTGLRVLQHCCCIADYLRREGIVLSETEIAHLYFIVQQYCFEHNHSKWEPRVLFVSAQRRGLKHLRWTLEKLLPWLQFAQIKEVPYIRFTEDEAAGCDYIFTDYIGSLNERIEGIPQVLVSFRSSFFEPVLSVHQQPFSNWLLEQIFPPELFFQQMDISGVREAFDIMERELTKVLGEKIGSFMKEARRQDSVLPFSRQNGLAVVMPYIDAQDDLPEFFSLFFCRKQFQWAGLRCRRIVVIHTGQNRTLYDQTVLDATRELMHNNSSVWNRQSELNYHDVLNLLTSREFAEKEGLDPINL
ncbi:MAG: helix-turn-helix domain-containing protein [Lachnospiraceae bacterium]|nr:helix-turn-helix domain-containing protein [Lachnospiraceae bacterium]